MNIPTFSVNRKIVVLMLTLIVCLFGIISFARIGIDMMPDLEYPFVSAITTILGMLPMALSHTEGAELRSPMAVAVASGLLFSTFLTLFIIPIVYSIVNKVSYGKG